MFTLFFIINIFVMEFRLSSYNCLGQVLKAGVWLSVWQREQPMRGYDTEMPQLERYKCVRRSLRTVPLHGNVQEAEQATKALS